jgi:hypothetical protein
MEIMANEQRPLTFRNSRRKFLAQAGLGFGALALNGLFAEEELQAAQSTAKNPLAAKQPHFPPTAKNVIFLFMEGGPSHLDTFDPKPALQKYAGQPLPASFKRPITAMGEVNSPLLGSKRTWKQFGEAGLWVSDWLPHTAQHVDKLAMLRGCWTNGINHSGGVCQMNTGTPIAGRPSLGAWVTYGLGSVNENLPGFVVIQDNPGPVTNGPRNWSTGFMPAVYQGTRLETGDEPIPNLYPPKGVNDSRQHGKLSLLSKLNRRHAETRGQQSELDARIQSYELAFRMQATAPEAVDITEETRATQDLYGMHEKETSVFARNCILARRLVERGVRFVQLYHGAGSKWDSHTQIEKKHPALCKSMDQCVAGLLTDLEQRGLLDSTLVVWGGEFGRTPMSEKGDGRDHNPTGFTMWMAGGGVRGGQIIGNTDELGLYAVEHRMHVHDIHASILHLLGLDRLRVEYRHQGRPERPTQNEGEFAEMLLRG